MLQARLMLEYALRNSLRLPEAICSPHFRRIIRYGVCRFTAPVGKLADGVSPQSGINVKVFKVLPFIL